MRLADYRIGLMLFVVTAFGWARCVSAADVQAATGRPFGVARITVPFPPRDVGGVLGNSAYGADDPQGRVCYPAFNQGFLRRVFGKDAPPPAYLTVLVLFRGNAPFDVTIRTPSPQVVHVTPRAQVPRVYGRLFRQWWRYYNAAARAQAARGDYPPVVETYLTSMLARRLGLAPPLIDQLRAQDKKTSLGGETLQLLAGAEKLRLATLRATSLAAELPRERARLPVPDAVQWHQSTPPPAAADVVIEPLAMHVPEECFYVRFGQFTNYLWMNQLLSDYGGDIGSMITARSLNLGINKRLERQLCLKQTALAEVVGPAVIADVAIIGRDTYTREGAAIGILFQARNVLLGTDLVRQQNEALANAKKLGATRETLKIAGHDVSFVSTPDNHLRSFYAVDGNFHLVTTSRKIVERFYEAGQGKRCLGAHPEFRYARTIMPVSRNDTVFAFFSTPLLEGLLGPEYQIELRRRMRAVTDIELVKLAQLAAHAERVPGATIDQLVAAQLLPRGFGKRADGSGPIVTDQGILDSMRGARGSFLPIPDVPMQAVTAAEQAWYHQRAEYFASNWQQLDPIMLAVRREQIDQDGHERLTIDARISPLHEAKYSFMASMLGPPLTQRVVPPDNTIITVEASVRGGALFPNVPPHIMFLAIEDHVPLTDFQSDNILGALQILRSTPGVLGAWPKPGFLDVLPLNLGGSRPDANGFSQLLFGILRWQGRGFSILSLDPRILRQASEQVGLQPTKDPAQIRIHAGDLAHAKFAAWLNAMMYERARQTSVGNARFLNLLTQQFDVPRTDALDVASDLLEAKMVCTLGGKYVLKDHAGTPLWQSTAWPPSRRYTLPDDYQSPLLSWFRGLDASLIKEKDRLLVHAQLNMQRKKSAATVKLPFLDLLGGKK